MKEIWKDIAGYEGVYQISSYGRVKSLARRLRNGYSIRSRFMRCSLRPRHKTLKVNLSRDNTAKTFDVHLLVLRAFAGDAESGYVAHHVDGDKMNNHLDNLEWVDWPFIWAKTTKGFPNLLGQ